MMKKTFTALFLLLMGGFTTAFAGNIAVEQLSTPYGQCNPQESKDINYYLQNELRQKPADSFYNTHSYGTLPRRTSNAIQLWTNGVLSSCQDWGLESNFFPASNSGSKYVIFQNHDACVFRKPNYTKENDPDRLDAQIHYKIAYSYVMPNGDKSATLPWYYRKNGENVYRCAENNQITNQTSTCPQSEKKYDSKIYQHLGECLNYRVFWCGDGLLNGQQGNTDYENGTFTEQCDPKDPNKTNWGNWGCNAECKPVNTIIPQPLGPKCNSKYNGQILDDLFPGSHLCSIGTYANFNYNPATLTWTWTCNGAVGTTPAQCSAKKKTTPQPQPVEPKCNSNYAGQTHYNHNYPVAWLNASMPLCKPGTVFAFQGPNEKGYYQRGCKLLGLSTEGNACQAKEQWCGDGIVQFDYEECDPNAPTQIPGKICTLACKLQDKPIYDLALTKTLVNFSVAIQSGDQNIGQPSYFMPGDPVKFRITVYNQGNLPAKNIQVTEYIPRGLLLDDSYWKQEGNLATRWIKDTILPWKKIELWLRMRIDPNFWGGKILNFAEISVDNANSYGTTDQDSIPNQNVNDDCIVGEDNHYISGNGLAGGPCTPATDEDDHDSVPILVSPEAPEVPPYIEKELNGDPAHLYQVGELVGFKMSFGNTGSQMIKNVKIRDFLPLNLEYVSSEIHGVYPYTSGLFLHWGQQVLEYSGFNLAPGQHGYLLMTGRVLSGNTNNTLNWVGIYENNYLWDWDDVLYQLWKKKLNIEKTVDKPQVMSGEVVEFTIKVTNLEGIYTHLTVKDRLPKGLVYVPDTWYLTGQTTLTQVLDFQNNLNELTWKLAFPKRFKKGDSFLIKFKAKLVEASQLHYTNIACVTVPGEPGEECDPEDVTPLAEAPKLKIKKYVGRDLQETDQNDTSLQFSVGTTAFFTLEVGQASAPFKTFRIEDQIPSNLEYVDSTDLPNNAFTGVMHFIRGHLITPEYTIKPSLSTTGANPKITWEVVFTKGEFIPWDRFIVKFKAKVKAAGTNTVHLYYPVSGGEGHDEDSAAVTIPTGSTSTGWGGGWSWGGSAYCGDGKQNGAEFCDWWGQYVIPENGQLFKYESGNINTGYVGYTCTKLCTLVKDHQLPACFNTQNGSISIMKWEMLPFYWNIEGMLGARSTAEKIQYLKNSFFLSKMDNTCESKDLWKIDLRTMQCTFAVYGPGKGNSKVVSAFTTDCINVNGWSKPNGDFYPLIQSFVEQNKNGWFGGSVLHHQGGVHNVFDTLDNWSYPTLLPISSKLIIENFGTNSAKLRGKGTTNLSSISIQTFGEYKLSLENIKFRTCVESTDDKGKTTYKLSNETNGYDRVCEVDFTVTDPYIIQKSPYGIGNKTTTNLDIYQLKNGKQFMEEFFPGTIVSPNAYETPKNMKSLFTTFKNKYAKLAKPVKGALKKVPGKSIYLIADRSIDLQALLGNSSKSFTLIATDPKADIIIRGNLPTNAMIMTQWTISFDARGACNGQASYGKAGQMVKGIFYAGEGFKSFNDQRNNDLFHTERCNYGNLHIKGVAIGDLSSVMNSRRSELYTWFNASSAIGTKKKADIIVNGASVLLEYNPSLWGNLPPGAEEFNKALEVYRK